MLAPLNSLTAVLALCGLLTRPVLAGSENLQTLVVGGDTFRGWNPPPADFVPSGVNFLRNKFANLPQKFTYPSAFSSGRDNEYTVKFRFNYSGAGQDVLEGHLPDGVRITAKFATGVLGLSGLTFGGAWLMSRGEEEDMDGSGDQLFREDLDRVVGGMIGLATGYLFVVPMGVTVWDPYDNPGLVWWASLLGVGAGFGLAVVIDSWLDDTDFILLPLLVSSPAFATLMSEWSRKLPESRRFSVGLIPDPKRRLSAVATLRF